MGLQNFRNHKTLKNTIYFIQTVRGISDLKASEDIKVFESLQNSETMVNASYQLYGNVFCTTLVEHIKTKQPAILQVSLVLKVLQKFSVL